MYSVIMLLAYAIVYSMFQFVMWDLDTMHSVSNIPTLGGFAFCLAKSPITPGMIQVKNANEN